VAPAAQAKNNLTCTIVDEAGKPMAKQEVSLVPAAGGKEVKEVKRKTDDKGVAEFKGLDDGSYKVKGQIQGYVITNSPATELSGNASKTCTATFASENYAGTMLAEVLELAKQKKFAEAEAQGKKAVEMLPEQSGAHYVLSVAYAYQGK
jgi:ATP-dependent exoDNAse (exonuclease V) beta subunit